MSEYSVSQSAILANATDVTMRLPVQTKTQILWQMEENE